MATPVRGAARSSPPRCPRTRARYATRHHRRGAGQPRPVDAGSAPAGSSPCRSAPAGDVSADTASPRLRHAAANVSVLRRMWRDAPPPVKALTWAVTMVIVALVLALAHGLGLSLPADVVSDLLRQTEGSRVITTTGRPVVRADVGEPRLALRPHHDAWAHIGQEQPPTLAHGRRSPHTPGHVEGPLRRIVPGHSPIWVAPSAGFEPAHPPPEWKPKLALLGPVSRENATNMALLAARENDL